MAFTQSITTDLQQWCWCRFYLWTLNNHSHLKTCESDNKEELGGGGGVDLGWGVEGNILYTSLLQNHH